MMKSTKQPRIIFAFFLALTVTAVIMTTDVLAAGSVSYVERSWDSDGKKVIETTRTADCTPMSACGNQIGDGWYYVDQDKSYGSSTRLYITGTVNLILTDGKKLNCKDGINVPSGSTLNIYAQEGGTGELICYADTNDNAAIGAEDEKGDCGTVNIHGGIITADAKKYGTDGAGIGGGDEGNGGPVTIYGGKITAIGGTYGAGIGGGDRDSDKGGNADTTRIYGGEVTATGGRHGAGIGGGELGNNAAVEIYGGTVKATGGTGGAGIGGGQKGSCGEITINGGTVSARGGDDAAGIGSGDSGQDGGSIIITGGEVNAYGGGGNEDGGDGAGIGGGEDRTGPDEITISGGKVRAEGSWNGAGIGGGDDGSSGNITITGGDVEAVCGNFSAGIGGGRGRGIGDSRNTRRVLITGGSVKITVGRGTYSTMRYVGAGIGGGCHCNQIGDVIIQGGDVSTESWAGAGIGGGGAYGQPGGNVTISGGMVVATSRTGAGIGGGGYDGRFEKYYENGDGGNVTISGGGVFASSTEGGAAIGGGAGRNGGKLTITDGYVVAITSPVKYDWADHIQTKITASTYGASMAAIIGNLLMKEILSDPQDRSPAAIGGGFADEPQGGAAGDFKMTGGTLIAKSGRAATPAIGKGDTNTDTKGSWYVSGNMAVQYTEDMNISPFELKCVNKWEREKYLKSKPYVMIEECIHAYRDCDARAGYREEHYCSCQACYKNYWWEPHEWDKASYTWSDDNSKVTAKHKCRLCGYDVEETVDTTTEITKEATCNDPGKKEYRANFTKKGFETQTKTVDTPADPVNGHNWVETGEIEGQDVCGGKAKQYECSICHETKQVGTGDHEWETEKYTTFVVATCTEQGEEYHKCKHCNALDLDNPHLTEPTGHEWGKPTYEWSEDGKGNPVCTAKRVCQKDPSHVEEEAVTAEEIITKEATCEESGEFVYEAYFENGAFEPQSSEPKEIEALGHDWDKPTYLWSSDYSSVTADRYCKHNRSHVDTETVEARSGITKEPTCEERGEAIYTSEGFKNEAFKVQETTGPVPALGHKWDSGKVIEAATCTEEGERIFTCEIDEDHTKTEEIPATGHKWDKGKITKAASCTAKGVRTYTCTACRITKTEAVTATGHKWGTPQYTWNKDNKSMTAKAVCKNDSGHVKKETVKTTSKVTKKATCKAAGTRVYTAVFKDSIFKKQTKKVSIAKVKTHTWSSWKVTKKATVYTKGTKARTCKVCGKKKTKCIPKLEVSGILLAKATASGKTALDYKWTKVNNVSGYDIFVARCNYKGKTYTCKKVKTIKGNKTLTWKQTKLKKNTCYKAYIRAYTIKNGKKKYIKKSPLIHVCTGDSRKSLTNPKSISLNRMSVTLAKGKSATLKGTVTKVRRGLRFPDGHAARVRYLTTNNKIATVNSSGKITAKSKGTCMIYAYAQNGLWKSCKVRVK